MEVKYSIFGVANKLKKESVNKAEHSPFRRVYRKAGKLIFNVIRDEKGDNESWRDEQIANVISFLGERGRGKTSAMLSFYSSINELQNKYNNGDNRVCFYTVPYIDAAMLAENEFIIDVILAKMWETFENYVRDPAHLFHDAQYEYLVKKVKEKFVEARNAYLTLKHKELNGDSDDERDIPTASALHELAVSLNLKEKIKALVEYYMQVVGYEAKAGREECYLVLAIDDVDMADISAQAVLEQIRRFLSIPQVIILLTADISRLREVCAAYYRKKPMEMQDVDLQKFIVDYLEKVLPINMRIYMPELSENRGNIEIDLNNGQDLQYEFKSSFEKDMILEFIANKCQIYFDAERGRRSFLQNDSLRSMVNYFDEIINLEDEENEYIIWLRKDLQSRIFERVENEKQRSFLRRILRGDYDNINHMVGDYIYWQEDGNIALNVSEESVGQTLYLCHELAALDAENIDFVNSIIALYSLVMRQADMELKRKLLGNCVWGEWEYGMLTASARVSDFVSDFSARAELELELTDQVKRLMQEKKVNEAIDALLAINENQINAWILSMLFVNIEMPLSGILTFEVRAEGYSFDPAKEKTGEVGEGKSYLVLRPQLSAKKSFFKFLFMDAEEQKEMLRALLENGIEALVEKSAELTKVAVDVNQYTAYIDNKIKWLDSFGWESCVSQELLQSVEIVYSIGQELGREKAASISEAVKLFERTAVIYKIVQYELEKRDQYYKNNMGIETEFAGCIAKSLQARLLYGEVNLRPELSDEFRNRFNRLFRSVRDFAIPTKS